MPITEWIDTLPATVCACAGAFTDLRTRRIPNWLTFSGLMTGLVLQLACHGVQAALLALVASVLCGGTFLLFYLAGGLGAGDVKFIAALAALLGWSCVVPLLVWTVLAGGLMAIVLALMRGKLRVTLRNALTLFAHHRRAGLKPHPEMHVLNTNMLRLPYGVAIACGCALTITLQTGVR